MDATIKQAAELLCVCQRLVVLTGAGVSKESGVPTFRDALDGLWARYDPEQLATVRAFRQDPKLVWDWYEYRRAMVRQAQPNPGHLALAELERLLPEVVIVTQNVDDLHQRAGSADVVALHGAIMRSKCFNNCQGESTVIAVDGPGKDTAQDGPPRCPHCGGWLRPDVVWFGESLPQAALQRAIALAERADVMLVVGTSGVVQPAASLPFIAYEAGAEVIDINPNPSGISEIARLWLQGPSGELLPKLVVALRKGQARIHGDEA
ncbi:MAG: NAD-dependent deacylase [Anaerolineae bacterium]|nr:NAD-dependent deacylase [Anaerolineae bacterium]